LKKNSTGLTLGAAMRHARLFHNFSFPAIILFLLIGALSLACGSSEGIGDDDDDSDNAAYAGDDDGDGGDQFSDDDVGDDGAEQDDDADDDDPPPEPEDDIDPGRRPKICGDSVYILSTEGDFITQVNAVNLAVNTIEVGSNPISMQTTENCDKLATLNSGDDTVTIVDPANQTTLERLVRPGLNSLQISPGDQYAVAFHKFDGGQSGGTIGYGEVSIVDLDAAPEADAVVSLGVGFPPDLVAFTPDGAYALLLSETTVALVELDTGIYQTLPTGLDVQAGQKVKKIGITANGLYALILAEASQNILALDLGDMELSEVDLGCFPTDLDISEDGDVSLLVCKQSNQVLILDNDDLGLTVFDIDEVAGSGEMTTDGALALLFTNAEYIEEIHAFDTETGGLDTYLTVKPIKAAALAPDDASAILFHEGGDNDPIDDFDAYFDNKHAFSIMTINQGRITPVETPERPEVVSFDPNGQYAIIPLPVSRRIVLADLVFGLADEIETPSPPLEAGLILVDGGVMGYILQEHDLGRISFFDTDDQNLQLRTITGFLLNSDIE
jgi:hypothetical protein